MVCIAMMFGPVKHSTYLRTYREENNQKKYYKHERQQEGMLRKQRDLGVWLRTGVRKRRSRWRCAGQQAGSGVAHKQAMEDGEQVAGWA